MIVIYESDYTDRDRWVIFDRYPRSIISAILRKERRFGQTQAFLNFCAGLDVANVQYVINPGRQLLEISDLPVILFGQQKVVSYLKRYSDTKFIVGPALFSHPLECPRLSEYENVIKILVPGPWMRDMCAQYWGSKVCSWPVGIDMSIWKSSTEKKKNTDFLIYKKHLWDLGGDMSAVYTKIKKALDKRNLSYKEVVYGEYDIAEYQSKLASCHAMIYLCEHETQGIAYQEALSSGVPLLAYDNEGYWLDPRFYPWRVKYQPVSSVPYWDERCGEKFRNVGELDEKLDLFLSGLKENRYKPRSFVRDNLSLVQSTRRFLSIVDDI